MTTIIYEETFYVDNRTIKVKFDTENNLFVNGMPVPAGRLFIDNNTHDDAEIFAAAFNGLHYRMDLTPTIVLVAEPEEGDDILVRNADLGYSAVLRNELHRPRPLLEEYDGIMARKGDCHDAQIALALWLAAVKELDLVPVSIIDDKLFAVNKPSRQALFASYDLIPRVVHEREQLVRVGVLLKRPGGYALNLTLRGTPFDKDDGDGLIMINTELDAPRQGTWFGENRAMKGIVRPPLKLGRATEKEAFCSIAEFKAPTAEGMRGAFHTVRQLTSNRPSANLQMLQFSMAEPEEFIDQDNRRLNNMRPIDMVRKDQRKKVEMGVPAGLLLDPMTWKWARRFELDKAVSVPAFCSSLCERSGFYLLPDTYKDLKRQDKHLIVGDTCIVHRDPALPNATSTRYMEFRGVITWANQKGGFGMVVHPRNRAWNAMGGDFDGDTAVIMSNRSTLALKDGRSLPYTYRTHTPQPMARSGNQVDVGATLYAMTNNFQSSLGATVLTAAKLQEVDQLSSEDGARLTNLIQAAVDSKKHPVNAARCRRDFAEYQEALENLPTTFTELMNNMNRAEGEDERAEVWARLVDWTETDPVTLLQTTLQDRIKILDRLYHDSGMLRGHRLGFPEMLKTQAYLQAQENPDADAEALYMKVWAASFRNAVKALAKAPDDTEAEEAKEVVTMLRNQLESAYMDGTITASTMILYGPAKTVAQLLTVHDIETLGLKAREGVVTLIKPVVDGEALTSALQPTPASKDDFAVLTLGYDRCEVQILHEADTYVRANLRMVKQVNEQPLNAADLFV